VMYGWANDTIGPMTRTVEDCALFLQALAGFDPKDALSSTRPVPDYSKSLTGDLTGLRLAVVVEMTWTDDIHPEVRAAMQASIAALKALGAIVEEVSLPLVKHVVPLRMLTNDVDVASVFLHQFLRTRWDDLDVNTRGRFAAALVIPAPVYSRAMRARAVVRAQILGALHRYDALLGPGDVKPPARIADVQDTVETPEMAKGVFARRASNGPFAFANMPALALPNGFSSAGLPVSLQIGGRPFGEETVFRIAHALEQATPWHARHPELERTLTRS
jgi:aspartyl-tRNA(Asn)/glutamyl-tRNA(Gln) amidotransferase subunit A